MSIVSTICSCIRKYYRFQAGKYAGIAIGTQAGSIHFSVDDCIEIFKELTDKQDCFKSMFDQPILGYLKELHEAYGIKVSLYCFYEDLNGFNLSQATDLYAKEFMDNSDWLKLGFHGKNCHLLYDAASAEEAAQDYTVFIKELQRICGGSASITKVVRLSGFQGNRDAVLAMRDCSHGIRGLFTADDSRKSYYKEADYSSEEDVVMDAIHYYHTDLRVENCSWRSIRLPDQQKKSVIFTHEYYLQSQKMQIRLEKLFCICVKEGRKFSFFE